MYHGRAWYRGLKLRDIETEMIVYPRAGHVLHRLDDRVAHLAGADGGGVVAVGLHVVGGKGREMAQKREDNGTGYFSGTVACPLIFYLPTYEYKGWLPMSCYLQASFCDN